MEFHLLPILAFLSLMLIASHATLSPEAYWNSVLPNSPMPKAVKDLLHPEWMEDKSTSVGVGKGGVSIDAGKGKPGGASVGVGKGGTSVNTGQTYNHPKIPYIYTYAALQINSMIIPTSLFSSWKMT
ncbi:hypothetical protein ACSBR1_000997 [Camellia fascicularis]